MLVGFAKPTAAILITMGTAPMAHGSTPASPPLATSAIVITRDHDGVMQCPLNDSSSSCHGSVMRHDGA